MINYVPYDEADKSDWVSIDIDFEDEILDLLQEFADMDNKSIGDYLSKVIYENYYEMLKYDKLDEYIKDSSIVINKSMLNLNESDTSK